MSQEKALEHLKVTESKTVAAGQKMDLLFYTLLIGFFDMDFDLIAKSIEKAKSESSAGLFSAYLIKKLDFGRHSTGREIALMILMYVF
ncbi:hypothetical protein RIF29_30105 [Crotalaria pallida]|uniref:26S proteasome regulatory subunit Rpn7 N-terminal domain-containing protein n=1 Tax=Crotalaria pallida TaxID=3830 RepID=A0AAN9EI31_CROPI